MNHIEYDPIIVTKNRLCTILAQSEEVRNALDYKAIDVEKSYDPEDPLTLVWNCIYPVLKDLDTITSSDPQILIGLNSSPSYIDPRKIECTGSIIIVVHNNDLSSPEQFLREDLAKDGFCAASKADVIAHYVIKALSSQESRTWIGDIQWGLREEGALNNSMHYAVTLQFMLQEINIGNRGV